MFATWEDEYIEEMEPELDLTAVPLGRYHFDVSKGLLKLGGINLTMEELRDIYGFLTETSIVWSIDFSNNPLSHEEIAFIAKILQDNQEIRELKLSECEIYSEGDEYIQAIENLYNAIAQHQRLYTIDLAGNKLDSKTKQEFKLLAESIGIYINLEWCIPPFALMDSQSHYTPVESIFDTLSIGVQKQ